MAAVMSSSAIYDLGDMLMKVSFGKNNNNNNKVKLN